jgi:hypothetical protein
MLRAAFKLPLRQTEGLVASVITLMDLTISAPDHTSVSRRAVTLPVNQSAQVPQGPLHVLIDSAGLQVYGTGQWLEAKPGAKSRRKWRKLHLVIDAGSGMIVAQTPTDQDADDPSQVAPLLDQIDGQITRVTTDGAYDGDPTYETIAAHGDSIKVVIPPCSTAVSSGEPDPPTQRDRHLRRSRNGDDGPGRSPPTCCPADRSRHRGGGAEPDAGDRTPRNLFVAGGPSQAAQGWGISPFIRRVHQSHLTYVENTTLKARHRHNPTIRPTCG